MSTIEVNKIIPQGSGTSVQLGESGDTITIPSGATITNNGTASGFGGGDLVNDTSPQLGGDLDTNGHDIDFKDTDKAVFGTGSDFEIVHNPVSGNLLNLAANPLEMHQVGGNSVLQLYRDPGNGVIAQFFGGTTQAGSINTDTVSSSPSLEVNAVGSFAVRTNNGTERMRVLSNGNVGIGTNSPQALLEIQGNSSPALEIDNTSQRWKIGAGWNTGTSDEFFIQDKTDNRVDFLIEGNGNVGIGETAPLGKLHVKTADTGASAVSGSADELILEGTGNVGMTIQSANDGVGNVYFGDVANGSVGRVSYDHSSNSMSFNVNAAETFNQNTSTTKFNYAGTHNVRSYGWVGNGSGQGWKIQRDSNQGSMLIETNLTTTRTMFSVINGNGTVGTISVNGSATSYNTSSDYRLKENEVAISDGIARLKQLKPYRFNFKTDADTTVDGFFAHEVSSVIPEAITGDKDAMHPEVLYTADDELPEGKEIGDVKEATKINPQAIDQSKLVPLLTSALQEAITKIETLEAKVAALESA